MAKEPGSDTIRFVDLGKQFAGIADEIRRAIDQVLTRGDFVLGSEVSRFEECFAEFAGVDHAVGVASGLDALRLALAALDIGPGDEVILPANTFIATALAVSAVGARPVLVDCDPRTYNIDVSQIESAMTPQTRALLPVHLTGQSADMDTICAIADRHNLPVVEDAAQAHGAEYRGRRCGSLGRAGCFSFYPGKNLGAYGDGGLITTNDGALATRIRQLRNYGQDVKYVHAEQGVNSRLDTIQAAVLNVKLPRITEWNAARYSCAQQYRALLDGVGDLQFQLESEFSTHVYHLFMVETEHRDELQRHLGDKNIQTGIHYPIPIHLQDAYKDLGYRAGSFPAAERLAGRILSLPMFPELESSQIERVVDAIRNWF